MWNPVLGLQEMVTTTIQLTTPSLQAQHTSNYNVEIEVGYSLPRSDRPAMEGQLLRQRAVARSLKLVDHGGWAVMVAFA